MYIYIYVYIRISKYIYIHRERESGCITRYSYHRRAIMNSSTKGGKKTQQTTPKNEGPLFYSNGSVVSIFAREFRYLN